MSKTGRETQIAQRFATWLSSKTGHSYDVIRGPNPPDFLLNPRTWLEVTDIYLSNEEAKFENSLEQQSFRFHCSPDQPALRLFDKLTQKLRACHAL